MAREIPSFHAFLCQVRRFLGRQRDEMADAVIEAVREMSRAPARRVAQGSASLQALVPWCS